MEIFSKRFLTSTGPLLIFMAQTLKVSLEQLRHAFAPSKYIVSKVYLGGTIY